MVILVQAMFEGNTQNPKIMRILAEEWRKKGHRVIMFFPCASSKKNKMMRQNENVYAFNFPAKEAYKAFLNELDASKKLLYSLILCFFKHPLCTFEFVLRRMPLFSNLLDESRIIQRKTERAVRKYNVDVVVAGSNPFYLPLGLARSDVRCKKIWYQMDPHTANGMMNKKAEKREKEKEIFVYEQMDRIFVQPNSYESIVGSLNKEIASKVFPTKFPLVNPEILVTPNRSYFEADTINCVYAGALMLPIRRPEYMFELFSLFKNKSIRLYIWSGNLTESMEAEMKAIMPSNVTYCGSLPQVEMQSVLVGADCLVSLGNTITNQLPSKLLDYISIRKPILNIYKVDECPTLDILSGYPLSISVCEKEDARSAAEKTERFILANVGKTADVETVKKEFHEYLPNTVAEYVLQS